MGLRSTTFHLAIGPLLFLTTTLAFPSFAASPDTPATPASAPAPLALRPALPAGFADAVAQMTPPVVNVSTRRVLPRGTAGRKAADGEGSQSGGIEHLFDHLWSGGPASGGSREARRSLGSGVIIDKTGYILTNNHVIGDATEIKVTLADEREFPARLVGRDPHTDVALLKIDAPQNLPVATLGDSEASRVGDGVVAIGNPFGLSQTVTSGIVSAKGRVLGAGPYDDFVQTDASINPGNSGGPLYNLRGEVIGINTAIVESARGIGFAIPANLVKSLLPQLREKGRVVRAFLGVGVQHVTPELARAFDLESIEGALVSAVDPRGPAARAGLHPGDVIRAVNGHKVTTSDRLAEMVAVNAPGSRLPLEVVRAGKPLHLEARVQALHDDPPGDGDDDGERQKVSGRDEKPRFLGIVIRALSPSELGQAGEPGVIVEEVDPEGVAAGSLESGDVIVEVDRRPTKNVEQFLAITKAARETRSAHPMLLRIHRGESAMFVTVDRVEPPR